MTDEADFLRAIIAAPDIDLPRLVYADWLEETAAVETCRRCRGYGQFFQGSMAQIRKCPDCHGTGSVLNGHAERAEFIRVQCELARTPEELPAERLITDLDWHSRRDWPDGWRFEPTDQANKIGVLHFTIRNPRHGAHRRREQELAARLDMTTFGFPPDICHGECHRGFPEIITISWSDWRTHAAAIRERTPLRRVRLTDRPQPLDFRRTSNPDLFTHLDYPGIEFEMPQPPQYRVEWGEETVVAPAGGWTRG